MLSWESGRNALPARVLFNLNTTDMSKFEPKSPSKVVIIPRPPRCAKPELTPIDQAEPAAAAQNASPAALNHTILPGDPLNNQVEGPDEGLAGEPEEK